MPQPDDSPPSSVPSPPPPLPPVAAVFASQDWADVSRRLAKYAYVRIHKSSWEDAEAIAQDAIVHLLDEAHAAWDRERHPKLFDCLGHLVNGLAANHLRLRRVRAQHVALREDSEVHDDELEVPDEEAATTMPREESEELAPREETAFLTDLTHPRPVSGAATARDEEAALAMLRARLEGDAICLAILDGIRSGVGKPAEQARRLDVEVADVYLAHRRIGHHVRRVKAALEAGAS